MFRELRLTEAAEKAREAGIAPPRAAIVAGSGLGGLSARLESTVKIDYSDLPGVPVTEHVLGHGGALFGGMLAGVPVIVFGGRVHRYQGVSALESAFTARIAAAMGAEVLVVTNAAGGIAEHLRPGDILALADHVNLTGDNPLVGWTGPAGGTPFVPMNDAYDPALRATASEAADAEGLELKSGVYFGLLGPTYETPAEVAMLRSLGADVVGMSTVNEVIVARALGMRVLGLSLVTNVAAAHGLGHEEVLQAGERAAADLERLLAGILRRL